MQGFTLPAKQTAMHELIQVETDTEYTLAASLFSEYAESLGIDLSFQKFDEELAHLKSMYAAPFGGIVLYKLHNDYIGCIAIRKQQNGIAELKRMYVKPEMQGKGIGYALLDEAIILAKKYGYTKMRLDTLSNMTHAIKLYMKNGFCEIPPYYFNPEKNAVYFEKNL